ncbi:MAG: ABC transporter ATP-binding protein [Anaerolineae bacterium]|nr:ABC transporter ATP-binding protein [Anaerolineae bacterium]
MQSGPLSLENRAGELQDNGQPLLQIRDLKVGFAKSHGILPVINTANLTLGRREAIGVVGESGSGKTMLCRSVLGTLDRHGARVLGGQIMFEAHDLANAPESVWSKVRGKQIGYVPQSSLAGLNPVINVKTQMVEAITAARPMSVQDAEKEAVELLEVVRIPRAKDVLREYSYQLSGGMRQRVMIAAALAQKPKLLVADEPTTALDVTVQKEILTLISRLRRELGMALILVSHDLAVIEEVCDSLMVMYAGASFEAGSVSVTVHAPRHPYTKALHDSRVDTAERGKPLEAIAGEPPTIGSWPSGCRFWPRCPLGDDKCRAGDQPTLRHVAQQLTACIYAERMGDGHD